MNKGTIILAEDEKLLRRTTGRFLTQKGYSVLAAENGKEALEIFRDQRPDLILTDLRMPVMGGMELLSRVAEEDPDLPIIIFSGMGKMIDVIDALRVGAWDYITKPVESLEVVQHCIERALERAEFLKNEKQQKALLEEQVRVRTESLAVKNQHLLEEIAQRKAQEDKVIQAKNEWQRTVDAMPDMIAIIDHDHNIIRVNETLRRTLGKSFAEIQGKKCYACLHGCDRPKGYCLHHKMIEGGDQARIEVYEEKLGGNCEIIASPYHNPEGELVGSVHIIRNINERRSYEQEKDRLLTQLLHAQKLESVGQLASGIAHEINTPTQFIRSNISFLQDAFQEVDTFFHSVAGIQGSTGQDANRYRSAVEALDWGELGDEMADAIKQSADGAARITSIVLAMKEFSHPGNKAKEMYDINRLIETTVTVAMNEWKYVSGVEKKLSDNLPLIACYPDELGQVFLNMLVNSAQSIAEKLGDNPEGEKGLIEIESFLDGEAVCVVIRDSGQGISEIIQDRVFEPFFTTKEVGKGTGQGLTICHDVIVKKHGGKIELESVLGEGTTFRIRLPIGSEK